MGSTTRTVTEAKPPILMPEGSEGYGLGSDFYKRQLGQPSVYQGQRSAGAFPLQEEAFAQGQNIFGNLREPGWEQQAKGAAQETMAGRWMTGPEAQNAAAGLAQPLFERFENQTMPGIRDRANFATRGSGGSRRTVAEHNALQELGQSYASGVAAPIFSGERERMVKTGLEAPAAFTNADIARTAGMAALGEQQRQLADKPLTEEQQRFEEGLGRQAAGAESLIAAATTGPGGSNAAYMPSTARMILGAGKA